MVLVSRSTLNWPPCGVGGWDEKGVKESKVGERCELRLGKGVLVSRSTLNWPPCGVGGWEMVNVNSLVMNGNGFPTSSTWEGGEGCEVRLRVGFRRAGSWVKVEGEV